MQEQNLWLQKDEDEAKKLSEFRKNNSAQNKSFSKR